jgi:hypothetical protein
MDPVGRRAALALLSLAAIWGLALPWLACARESSSLLAMTGRAAFALGHVICHQRPERSFFSCGLQWPVCGRCSGLYLGAAAGAVLALAIGWRAQGRRTTTPDSDSARWRRILLVAALPTAVLWIIEFAGILDPGTIVLLRCRSAWPHPAGWQPWLAGTCGKLLRCVLPPSSGHQA